MQVNPAHIDPCELHHFAIPVVVRAIGGNRHPDLGLATTGSAGQQLCARSTSVGCYGGRRANSAPHLGFAVHFVGFADGSLHLGVDRRSHPDPKRAIRRKSSSVVRFSGSSIPCGCGRIWFGCCWRPIFPMARRSPARTLSQSLSSIPAIVRMRCPPRFNVDSILLTITYVQD